MENNKDIPFISDIIKQIEDYYGVNEHSNFSLEAYSFLYGNIVNERLHQGKFFKVEHKGHIVLGKLGNILSRDLMIIREQYSQKKFTDTDWQNCLLPLSDRLTYCEESNIIYQGIDSEIRDWLIKTKASDIMHKLACNMVILPKLNGETIKIYSTFIKKR